MSEETFFFYDLETSGISPATSRIMQFAGQRTSLSLKPIGEPVNVLIKLTPDILPDPDAILITGITPQQTISDGISEVDFLKQFSKDIALPKTIFVGYNTVRFDDEFIRFLHYRNFYDPYEWQWKDGRSKWDLLDFVRMTRALRPEGIKWPFASDGKPTNRLELLTKMNGLDHFAAHDALSDVQASIELAKLLHEKQPKLFNFLLELRDKKKIAAMVKKNVPFVYTSGKYSGEYEKTTIVKYLADHPKKQGALVYDLRFDPNIYKGMSVEKLVELWRWKKDSTEPRLPIKTLQYNRCPAVAPLGVLDQKSQNRIKISIKDIIINQKTLDSMPEFIEQVVKASEIMDNQFQTELISNPRSVDAQLYDGFIADQDKILEKKVQQAKPENLNKLIGSFYDPRLNELLPLYKARNFSNTLTSEERAKWDEYCVKTLAGNGDQSPLAKYFSRIAELAEASWLTDEQRYNLQELQLYGQSLLPFENDA